MNASEVMKIILSAAQAVDTIAGTKIGGAGIAVLQLLASRAKLTPEQTANLEANHRDYIERIAKLNSEIAATPEP